MEDTGRKYVGIGYAICAVSFLTFGLEIALTWMNYWSKSMNYTVIQQTVAPLIDIGLWRICSGSSNTRNGMAQNCANIGPMHVPTNVVPAWVHAVRAFMIIAIILAFVALVLSILGTDSCSQFRGKSRKMVNLGANTCLLLSGTLLLISTSWWGGMTLRNTAWGWSNRASGFGSANINATGKNFTIGTCVILGWVIGPLCMIVSCVGCFLAWQIDDDEDDMLGYTDTGYNQSIHVPYDAKASLMTQPYPPTNQYPPNHNYSSVGSNNRAPTNYSNYKPRQNFNQAPPSRGRTFQNYPPQNADWC